MLAALILTALTAATWQEATWLPVREITSRDSAVRGTTQTRIFHRNEPSTEDWTFNNMAMSGPTHTQVSERHTLDTAFEFDHNDHRSGLDHVNVSAYIPPPSVYDTKYSVWANWNGESTSTTHDLNDPTNTGPVSTQNMLVPRIRNA